MEGGPPKFRQDFTCPALLKNLRGALPIRGYHPLWPAFPDGSGFTTKITGLVRVRSPLLAESLLISFPPATEMFQFAGFASYGYVFTARYPKGVGFPIRTFPDQSLLPTPQDFSQGATSFIASRCQGIHQIPLSRLLSILLTHEQDPLGWPDRSRRPLSGPTATVRPFPNHIVERVY